MHIIFVISLLRKMVDGDEVAAQVRILEDNGTFEMTWEETGKGEQKGPDCWYYGNSVEALMLQYKQRITEKLSNGFVPMLEGIDDVFQMGEYKGLRTTMLHYYSELHCNQEVYLKLKKWRSTVSVREGIAPYMICSNKVMQMISTFLPQTHEELMQIPGMGARKIEMYGAAMIKQLKSFNRTTAFPLNWVKNEIDDTAFKQWLYRLKYEKLKKDIDTKHLRQNLLEGINQGNSIAELAKQCSLSRRETLGWIETLDKEGYDVLPVVVMELESVKEDEKLKAWDCFKDVGTRYLKPVLERLYNPSELKDDELITKYEQLRLIRIEFNRNEQTIQGQAVS